ncbi:MAG: DUF192 domain-containing protein [bacterium]
MKYFFYFFTMMTVLNLACNKTQGQKAAPANQASTQKSPSITIDGVDIEVEIVQDAKSRQLGLMYRDELAENRGMLFVFESPQILSFWMRNTYIPLDIAFIDANGVIVDIQHMEPLDESINYISSAPALYALEVNAGWFEKNNLKTGSQVQF